MVRFNSVFFGLSGFFVLACATSPPWKGGKPGKSDKLPGCGEVDIFLTGLPAYDPYVIDLGLDPAMVDSMLREDHTSLITKGYNVKFVSIGTAEDHESILKEELRGRRWLGAGIGFGLRGSQEPNITIQLEDTIQVFRDEARHATIMMNYNARTFGWAVQRRLPLAGNCTGSPGKNLGFIDHCSECENRDE